MRSFAVCLCCVVAALFLVPQAQGQQCPAAFPNPLQLIDGQTWAFQTGAGDFGPIGMASIGTFKAQYVPAGADPKNPFPHGVLTVNESVNGSTLGGGPQSLTRLASITGRYQIYWDCSGGQLSFMLNQQAIQWEFVFASGFTEMYMTSQSLQDNSGLTQTYKGVATLGAATACPSGIDPLQLLDGTMWSFHASAAAFEGSGSSHVGTFKPKFVAGGADPKNALPHGVLATVESVSYSYLPTVTRLESGTGRYTVYPDCSGGTLMIAGAQPVTYEFVFPDNNFNRMLLLSDTLRTALNPADILGGEAKVF
jgi:hypothetical protein